MDLELKRQIAELEKMTVTELRQKHVELFGEENRSGHRQYLFRRIAWRLQAKAEGDLSQRANNRAMELSRDADVRMTPPQIEQGPETGEFAVTGTLPRNRDDRLPMPGAVLTRRYKGKLFKVTVMPVGFEFDGKMYRSLSAIAKAITGCGWNGFHFFKLTHNEKTT